MSGWGPETFAGADNDALLSMAAELVNQGGLTSSDRAFLDAIMDELIRRGAHLSPRPAP